MLLNLKFRRRSVDMQELRVYICKKYEGEEDFINQTLDDICSHENISAVEAIHFLFSIFTVYIFSFCCLPV